MKSWIVLIALTISLNNFCDGKPVEQLTDFSPQTIGSIATDYPEVHKKIINFDEALSPDVTKMLEKFNLNVDELKEQQKQMLSRGKNRSMPSAFVTTESSSITTNEEEYVSKRINNVKSIIENVRDSGEVHESTYAPSCEGIPRVFTINEWFDHKTWNIFFKPKKIRMPSISSVIVRLYKKTLFDYDDDTATADLNQKVDDFYYVNLSVYIRQDISKDELKTTKYAKLLANSTRKTTILKKVIIGTATVAKDKCGWIEFNVSVLRKYWDEPKNNFGVAVDVYDHNEKHLNAKDHFSLQSCQAGQGRFPWSIHSKFFGKNPSAHIPEDEEDVFKDARIDINLTSLSHQKKRHVRNIHHHQGHTQRHLNQNLLHKVQHER